MLAQPGGDGRRLAIRQQVDDGTAFEIANQRSIALSFAPSPVIDPDDARFIAMVRTPDAAPRRKVSVLTHITEDSVQVPEQADRPFARPR